MQKFISEPCLVITPLTTLASADWSSKTTPTMSNSVMSLVFPLSGQDCLFSRGDEGQLQQPGELLLRKEKLFSKDRKSNSKIGLIVTSKHTKESVVYIQRRLLFQAGLTKASSGEKVVAILPKPWQKPPFGLNDDSGVHRMPKLVAENIANFKFVYPKNSRELLFYIAALGGFKADESLAEIPDMVLIENVEQICESSVFHKTVKTIRRLLTSLVSLSDHISDRKPFDVLITSAKKELFDDIGQYLFWVDEIWETGGVDDDDDVTLTSVDDKLPFHYCLNFKVSDKSNRIFFKSLVAENDDDPSSPVF